MRLIEGEKFSWEPQYRELNGKNVYEGYPTSYDSIKYENIPMVLKSYGDDYYYFYDTGKSVILVCLLRSWFINHKPIKKLGIIENKYGFKKEKQVFMFVESNYDLFNFKDYMIFGFQFTYTYQKSLDSIIKLSDQMETSLRTNAIYYSINSATNGLNETVTYQKFKSKEIVEPSKSSPALPHNQTKKVYSFISLEMFAGISLDILSRPDFLPPIYLQCHEFVHQSLLYFPRKATFDFLKQPLSHFFRLR